MLSLINSDELNVLYGMKNFKNIIVNSSILFVCAAVLQMTLHECGHFIAAILIHAKNVTLHHNYVSAETADMPISRAIFYAGAGPSVSLFIGVCFHFICFRQKTRGMLFLFNLYMAVFGYIAFFGYLMVAPFFTYGDTGYIFQALNFPIWLTGLIAIIGGLMLYVVMRKLIRFFVEMGTSNIIADKNVRRMFINALIQYPLYIGILITTLLNLPTPTVLSLIYPAFSPFSIMWVYGNGLSMSYPAENMNTDISSINRIQPVWLIIFFLIIVMNRLLVYGIVAH
jgi:hypothetical protein